MLQSQSLAPWQAAWTSPSSSVYISLLSSPADCSCNTPREFLPLSCHFRLVQALNLLPGNYNPLTIGLSSSWISPQIHPSVSFIKCKSSSSAYKPLIAAPYGSLPSLTSTSSSSLLENKFKFCSRHTEPSPVTLWPLPSTSSCQLLPTHILSLDDQSPVSASLICTVDSSEICKTMCKEVHASIKWHHKNGHNGNVTAIK